MQISWVYITTNKNKTTLYTGLSSNLIKRMGEHKSKKFKGFSARYNCDILVYFQEFSDIKQAIVFEKKIKAGSRAKKEELINSQNPEWNDLSDGWIFPLSLQ